MPRIKVNGVDHEVKAGQTILEVLQGLGIDVPTLCHDPRVRPTGACRLCSVEVAGSGRLVAACTTPVSEGIDIQTHSSRAEECRRTNLRLLASNYPADEPLDDHVEFHRYLIQYGVVPSGQPQGGFKDDQHPYLRVDMDKCVHCFRCIRICDELQGQFVWRAWNRGEQTQIRPDKGASLLESSCVSCGACSDTCPSGAIFDRAVIEQGLPDKWTRTTCPYCGTGCEMEVGTKGDQVVVARPVLDAPVNRGHLCVKGRYAHRFAHAKDRVKQPLIRVGDEWQEATWDEAYSLIHEKLRAILSDSGPGTIGVLGSSRATNEENYLAQKFARVVLGSNNVDCCARVCHAPSAAALKATLGTGAATNSFDDIELASGFLICGANPTENHPIVGARIRQAVLRGSSLVVIDPRAIELAQIADVHLKIRPGTNVPILHAIANELVRQGLVDLTYIDERTDDFEAFRRLVSEWSADRAAEVCGVEAEDIRRAAHAYGHAKPAMVFHGLGATEHVQGTEGVRCLVNLALLTGNLGRRGGGENPLRGQNNVQGSAHMGCEPSNLTGFTPIEMGASHFESVWCAPVPREQGLNWMQMLDSAASGTLRALYAIGYDVYFSNPNAAATAEALQNLEFVVVQDLFLNETAKAFAHVFLPACSSYEKDGTFMNSERRVQRVRQCIPVIGDSKPDWLIIAELASAMGFEEFFDFSSPEEIWREVQQVWKAGAGISYARIERHGLQWPCLSLDDPGTTILHSSSFPIGKKAGFSLIKYEPTPEQVDSWYPFLLNTGRTLAQFNAGTMTERTPNHEIRPSDLLELHPSDADGLGLENGDDVVVESRYGKAVLPVLITDRVRRGECFATFHSQKVFMNKVTGSHRDRVVGAPEYKVTAVRLTPVSANE